MNDDDGFGPWIEWVHENLEDYNGSPHQDILPDVTPCRVLLRDGSTMQGMLGEFYWSNEDESGDILKYQLPRNCGIYGEDVFGDPQAPSFDEQAMQGNPLWGQF